MRFSGHFFSFPLFVLVQVFVEKQLITSCNGQDSAFREDMVNVGQAVLDNKRIKYYVCGQQEDRRPAM